MCTLQKRGKIFYLTLTGTGDDAGQHRLSPSLITSIRSSLSEVKSQSTPGSVLITLAEGNKFFCNGFDLILRDNNNNNNNNNKSRSEAIYYLTDNNNNNNNNNKSRSETINYLGDNNNNNNNNNNNESSVYKSRSEAVNYLREMVTLLKDLIADLISLPMPTIAAVTGHAAAAGFVFAMSHDYVVMRRDRGVLYMSEVDISITVPEYFAAVFRSKVTRAEVRRDVLLRGVKVRADEALAKGLIDSAHENGEKTVEAAVRLGEELSKRNWDGEVYGEIRKSLYPELRGVLGLTMRSVNKGRL